MSRLFFLSLLVLALACKKEESAAPAPAASTTTPPPAIDRRDSVTGTYEGVATTISVSPSGNDTSYTWNIVTVSKQDTPPTSFSDGKNLLISGVSSMTCWMNSAYSYQHITVWQNGGTNGSFSDVSGPMVTMHHYDWRTTGNGYSVYTSFTGSLHR